MTVDASSPPPADSIELGARWTPWAQVGDALGDVPVTVATARRGAWQVRMLRVDAGAAVPVVRVTGFALGDGAREVAEVHQGVDVCVDAGAAGEQHSELRMLVPWDGEVAVSPSGAPVATVRDLPVGFPMIVAVRSGAEPPAVPQVEEVPSMQRGRIVRIRRTGVSIPEVELAPRSGGHAVTVVWPDREREVVLLPAPRTGQPARRSSSSSASA